MVLSERHRHRWSRFRGPSRRGTDRVRPTRPLSASDANDQVLDRPQLESGRDIVHEQGLAHPRRQRICGGRSAVRMWPIWSRALIRLSGRNAEGTGSLNSKGKAAMMYSYSRTRGLFGGVSIEGSVIVERSDANSKAYGRNVTAKQLRASDSDHHRTRPDAPSFGIDRGAGLRRGARAGRLAPRRLRPGPHLDRRPDGLARLSGYRRPVCVRIVVVSPGLSRQLADDLAHLWDPRFCLETLQLF